MTQFPEGLDNFTNPKSNDSMETVSHSSQHSNANDAIEALQKKVGIDNSDDINSIDYKIKKLTIKTWIDYIAIKTVEELENGIIKYTDADGSYYRKIIESPYEDIIYSDEALTIELTRRT